MYVYMLALHPVFTGWYNAGWASFLCAALSKLSIVYVYCIPPAEANPIHPSLKTPRDMKGTVNPHIKHV